MTWVLVAFGVAAGIEWRRLLILALTLIAPVPMISVIALHWWRARPGLSMRAVRFCEAVSTELRAGATLRASLERAGVSVEASEIVTRCREGASMAEIALAAGAEFGEIGPELKALLARADDLGVSPAALFDEIGGLAIAQVELAHEVSIASAPARATGAVLLIAPVVAIAWALRRGGLEPFVRQPTQRAAVMLGLALVGAGLCVSIVILRRAR